MKQKKGAGLYRIIRWLVRVFSPKYTLEHTDKLPEGACVIVGNHCHLYGPIASELYLPGRHYTWCIGEMMHRKDVPAYAFQDFWSIRPKWTHWFYKLLSHLIAPLSELIFTNAHTIGVYHDARLRNTFRESVEKLEEGSRIVIFPETYEEYNNIVHGFQDKFVDLGKLYARKTGAPLIFVPLYVAPRLKTLTFGDPILFRADAPIEEERERICRELMDAITQIAVSKPLHTVIPYPNVSKKEYQKNLPLEDYYGKTKTR
ncbi:MAG: hypothetical protein IJL47_05450 [Lachnospiraceae bacterium]|nr:hypothetical protein [Lachnospiraceae bacterium]MBQ6196951.1 hypothetical protein [Lachnospiraceae bacterium]